jgi:Fe-S-cluster containining protein
MSASCSHLCGGACCRRFPLSSSPAQMGEKYLELIAWRESGGAMEPWMLDRIMISEMVIPLAEESDEQPLYACRHLHDASGLCTVYEARPAMCRDFPSYGDPGRRCESCGFTQTPVEPELVQLKVAS